jgi:DNA processing protein
LSSPNGILDPTDTDPRAVAALGAWLALQWDLALDPVAAAALGRAEGDPHAALRASGPPRRSKPAPDARAVIERLRRLGARAIPLDSTAYPARLARLSDPSPLLLVRGDVDALSQPCVAIVGSRAATAYGLATARTLARDLARAGAVVVSGLALGIDAAAHDGALEAGGRTVAVLACGPDRIYPARHRGLAERVVRNGAIVSELPLGTHPLPQFFPLRNRLISGLSSAVVIVEARERSGSLITARHAADQGVDVFAVPGPVSAPTSVGPNRLLRDGAGVALEAADVLASLGMEPAPERPVAAVAGPPETAAVLSRRNELLATLSREPATRDELSRRLGRRPDQLAFDLLELELDDEIVRDRDGRWVRSPRRR